MMRMLACIPGLMDRLSVQSQQKPFSQIGRDLEPQYWSSMSTVITCLSLAIQGKVTEDKSALLCQLTRLSRLVLRSLEPSTPSAEETDASIFLDLPLLERLHIFRSGASQVRLNCPKVDELILAGVALKSFSGMPSSIRIVRLSLFQGSVPLKAIFPAHSAQQLQSLSTVEDPERVTEAETIRRLCLNGKLTHLRIEWAEPQNNRIAAAAATAGAFSLHAPWQAVPHTLQDVFLDLCLDKGIPRILEQLLNLTSLSLRHSKGNCLHLDRPLDPFLDMPRLKQLRLESRWQPGGADGAGALRSWTPAALRLLGLAEKRLTEMRVASPGRSFTLIY